MERALVEQDCMVGKNDGGPKCVSRFARPAAVRAGYYYALELNRPALGRVGGGGSL